jgi:hypothetical protein
MPATIEWPAWQRCAFYGAPVYVYGKSEWRPEQVHLLKIGRAPLEALPCTAMSADLIFVA